MASANERNRGDDLRSTTMTLQVPKRIEIQITPCSSLHDNPLAEGEEPDQWTVTAEVDGETLALGDIVEEINGVSVVYDDPELDDDGASEPFEAIAMLLLQKLAPDDEDGSDEDKDDDEDEDEGEVYDDLENDSAPGRPWTRVAKHTYALEYTYNAGTAEQPVPSKGCLVVYDGESNDALVDMPGRTIANLKGET